jgi:hypothetical protein
MKMNIKIVIARRPKADVAIQFLDCFAALATTGMEQSE